MTGAASRDLRVGKHFYGDEGSALDIPESCLSNHVCCQPICVKVKNEHAAKLMMLTETSAN